MIYKIVSISIIQISFLWATPPSWFDTQSLPHTRDQIIGYGEAQEYKEAIQIAKNNIAKMLQSNIHSTLTIDKNSSIDSYNKNINEIITETSHITLHNLQLIKKEHIDNRYFVAIQYDNLALFLKILKSISSKNTTSYKHPYLIKTELFRQLKEHLGFYPKATIYAQHGQYYIAINNQSFLISHDEFIELFINNINPIIEIKLKERLKNDESYFINMQFQESGFASLFLVSNSGTVVTMFKNIEPSSKLFTYPNKEEYNGLRAKIENSTKENREMFVAVLCKQKEDLGLFNQVSTELERDSFRFGQLIDLMERCAFSTRIITIYR